MLSVDDGYKNIITNNMFDICFYKGVFACCTYPFHGSAFPKLPNQIYPDLHLHEFTILRWLNVFLFCFSILMVTTFTKINTLRLNTFEMHGALPTSGFVWGGRVYVFSKFARALCTYKRGFKGIGRCTLLVR